MKKFFIQLIYLGLFLVFSHSVQSQICGFDQIRQEQIKNNPDFMKGYEAFEQQWQQYVAMQDLTTLRKVIEGADTIYEIPIVVHVMHTGGAVGSMYNRSDADIHAWINYTNEVFAGTATGIVGPGSGGARIPIRLVLAKRAPDCTPTTGIIRVNASSISGYNTNGVESSLGGTRYNAMKGLSRWDPTRYYNIYLVNRIDGEDGYSSSSYTAGFATMPPFVATDPMYSNALSDDGSVMLSYIVEAGETTFAHEIGHAFNLEHTFAPELSYPPTCSPAETASNCASVGDKVCDTEPSLALLGVPCPSSSSTNPCTDIAYNGVQYNIMNYSNCPNRFTPGQAARVAQSLLFFRSNLVHSNALDEIPTTPIETPIPPTFVPSGTAAISMNMGVGNVKLQEIDYKSMGYFYDGSIRYKDNTGADCNYYAGQAELLTGETYTISITLHDQTTNRESIRAAIDYNNNGSFDAIEYMFSYTNVTYGTYTATFSVPATATKNVPLRLRIKSDFHSGSSSVYDLHTNPVYGQTEDFTVIIRDEPLSINPMHLVVTSNNCANIVKWTLAEGIKYHSLLVERSDDGTTFEAIHQVANTESVSNHFVDEVNNSTRYIYRLAMIDLEGNISYSTAISAQATCTDKAVIYPNPTTDKIFIDYNANKVQVVNIKLIDVNGRVAHQQSATLVNGHNALSVDMQALNAGAYIVRLELEHDVIQQMIIKK